MPTCVISGCSNRSPLASFPRDYESFHKWILNIGNSSKNVDGFSMAESHRFRICLLHFEDKWINRVQPKVGQKHKWIMFGGVPTLHLPNKNLELFDHNYSKIQDKTVLASSSPASTVDTKCSEVNAASSIDNSTLLPESRTCLQAQEHVPQTVQSLSSTLQISNVRSLTALQSKPSLMSTPEISTLQNQNSQTSQLKKSRSRYYKPQLSKFQSQSKTISQIDLPPISLGTSHLQISLPEDFIPDIALPSKSSTSTQPLTTLSTNTLTQTHVPVTPLSTNALSSTLLSLFPQDAKSPLRPSVRNCSNPKVMLIKTMRDKGGRAPQVFVLPTSRTKGQGPQSFFIKTSRPHGNQPQVFVLKASGHKGPRGKIQKKSSEKKLPKAVEVPDLLEIDPDIETYMNSVLVSTLCRICLSKCDNTTSLSSQVLIDKSEAKDKVDVAKMITSISSAELQSNPGWPTSICKECLENTSNAYRFKLQCERSEKCLEAFFYNRSKKKNNPPLLIESLEDNYFNAANPHSVFNDPDVENAKPKMESTEIISDQKDDTVNVKKKKKNKSPKTPRIFISRQYKINEQGLKVFYCPYCNQQYKSAGSLGNHVRIHVMKPPFTCELCGKGYYNKIAHQRHMTYHTGEKPYVCKVCGKKYRLERSVRIHMREHTGETPYLCWICGQQFRHSCNLRFHIIRHAKDKRFMCSVCGVCKISSTVLKIHMRTHTGIKPYACNVCEKPFACKERLKRHEIIHTGLKPYVCEVCGKAYNQIGTLKMHMMSHSKVKPHVCHFCGKGFILPTYLRSHLKTHEKLK